MAIQDNVTPLDQTNLLHKADDDTMSGNLTFNNKAIFLTAATLKLPFGGAAERQGSGNLLDITGFVYLAYITGPAPSGSSPSFKIVDDLQENNCTFFFNDLFRMNPTNLTFAEKRGLRWSAFIITPGSSLADVEGIIHVGGF